MTRAHIEVVLTLSLKHAVALHARLHEIDDEDEEGLLIDIHNGLEDVITAAEKALEG